MAVQILKTSENPRIDVFTEGDLHIEGWENPEIKAVADSDVLKMLEKDGVVRVSSDDDLVIYLPIGADVHVQKASGDAQARRISGKLIVAAVNGDLTVQQTGGLEAGAVGGDCDLRSISGAVALQTVGGDLMGLDLQGGVQAFTVGGDAELEIKQGDLVVHTGGDVQAILQKPGENGVTARAGGDIELYFAPGLGISLTTHCGGDIELDFNGDGKDYDTSSLIETIGDGAVKVVAEAGGDVELSDRPWDLSRRYASFDSADQRWARWEEQMKQREEAIRERVDAATRRASEASRRAEEKIQAAMRRVDQKRAMWGNMPPAAPIPPIPARQQREVRVSEEERALILQMLQEKKITAEEAERLLEALEGQE